jgi:hypothetical protein
VREELLAEGARRVGDAVELEVAVVERHGVVPHLEERDLRAGAPCGVGGDGREPAIEGFAPRAAGEHEDAGRGGHERLLRDGGPAITGAQS